MRFVIETISTKYSFKKKKISHHSKSVRFVQNPSSVQNRNLFTTILLPLQSKRKPNYPTRIVYYASSCTFSTFNLYRCRFSINSSGVSRNNTFNIIRSARSYVLLLLLYTVTELDVEYKQYEIIKTYLVGRRDTMTVADDELFILQLIKPAEWLPTGLTVTGNTYKL